MQSRVDNTKKFSGKAEVYRKVRPTYAPELMIFLAKEWGVGPGTMVADIGSGTGIFTAQLLDLGATVFAVEPNADMRAIAEADLGDRDGFFSVDGTAEATGLPENSVDFVSAATAFHWFDPILFKQECARILKPGGKVALVWNWNELNEEVHQARDLVYRKYCTGFVGFSGGHKSQPEIKEAFFDGQMGVLRFPNPIEYDKERFVGRLLSSSYSITDENPDYQAYRSELEDIFDRLSVDGFISMPQETVLYYRA